MRCDNHHIARFPILVQGTHAHNAHVLHDMAMIGLFNVDVDDGVRASERVNVPYLARVLVDDEHRALTAHLVNLSEGGAALRVYGRLEPGTTARLIITVGRVQVDLPVCAVWTESDSQGRQVGVTFDALTPAEHAVLAEIVAEGHR